MSTIKIATLNINVITARTRVGMLADFIRQHDFDIIFTQEVTSTEVMNVRGYNAHLNIGLPYVERPFWQTARCISQIKLLCPQDER